MGERRSWGAGDAATDGNLEVDLWLKRQAEEPSRGWMKNSVGSY